MLFHASFALLLHSPALATGPVSLDAEIDTLLTRLPESTESVAVLKDPKGVDKWILPEPKEPVDPIKQMDQFGAGRPIIALEMTKLLMAIGSPLGDSYIWDLPFRFILHSGQNFKWPKAIGGGEYEGVKFYGLTKETLPKVQTWAKMKSDRREREGHEVTYIFPSEDLMDKNETRMAIIGEILVVANRDYLLKDVRKRFVESPRAVAFPKDLEQWKYIDRNSQFWLVRKIGEQDLKANMVNRKHDPGLYGYASHVDAQNPISITLFSTTPGNSEFGQNQFKEIRLKSEVRKHSESVSTFLVQRTEGYENAMVFYILGMFGHALAI